MASAGLDKLTAPADAGAAVTIRSLCYVTVAPNSDTSSILAG